MKSRFLSNVALALAGGFLVVGSQAFATSVLEWLAPPVGGCSLVDIRPSGGETSARRHSKCVHAYVPFTVRTAAFTTPAVRPGLKAG